MAASILKAKTAQGYGTGLTAKCYSQTSPYAIATNGTSGASAAISGQPGNYLFTFTDMPTGLYDLRIVTAADFEVATGMLNHTDAIGVEKPYIDLTGATVKAVTDAVPIQSGITKNAALANFEFLLISSTDHISGKTGLTVIAERSIDGGAFASCANAVTEVSAGVYKINLAAGDLNGDIVTLKFTGTGADSRLITIRPTP